ncbi:cell division protein FtsL, partial [Staphylococcus aureus]|nr:cell division protein FtsL [Staphylococcus aureus]
SENSALQSEIKKNSSYERIYEKAKKQGMSLENDNVKVVRSNGEAKN